MQYFTDNESGHVGGVVSCCELKLIDVPEMKYTTDCSNPQGEICIKGHSVFLGYYMQPELTDEVLS